jgi:hypothetical protein
MSPFVDMEIARTAPGAPLWVSRMKYLILIVLIAGVILGGLALLKVRSEDPAPKPRNKRR